MKRALQPLADCVVHDGDPGYGASHGDADLWRVVDEGQLSRLLGAHNERPSQRAAKRNYKLSASDLDCHVTPPAWGHAHAMRGQYHGLIVQRTHPNDRFGAFRTPAARAGEFEHAGVRNLLIMRLGGENRPSVYFRRPGS